MWPPAGGQPRRVSGPTLALVDEMPDADRPVAEVVLVGVANAGFFALELGGESHGATAPKAFQVPGVPATTHTYPMNPPAGGVSENDTSPTPQVPAAGAALAAL